MALSEPFDLLADFPGWTPVFELDRRQERSRTAGGTTLVKDLGPPLWQMSAVSKPLRPNELDYWRARLDALEEGMATFKGYPLSRVYPIAYPRASWPTGVAFDGVSGTLEIINANRKAVQIGGLPEGFVFSVGDMISINDRDLHRVMEAATADEFGLTSQFEIRPHLWPDVEVEDPALSVSVKRPHCIMSIVPGSISAQADISGIGTVSFQAAEARG